MDEVVKQNCQNNNSKEDVEEVKQDDFMTVKAEPLNIKQETNIKKETLAGSYCNNNNDFELNNEISSPNNSRGLGVIDYLIDSVITKPESCIENKTLEDSSSSCNFDVNDYDWNYETSSSDNLKGSCVKRSDNPPEPSKRTSKRRAGVLYKQVCSNSKLQKVNSKYFNQAHNTQKRWIPPRSPYALVQEDLFDKPWQLLIATIFLTKTAAKKALPHLHKFLARFPCPEDVLQASCTDVEEYFKPLGLANTRTQTVMRFTVEYLEKDWTYPRELYGIGKYGDDSYRMFCINEWRQVSPDDIPLTMYRNWLLEHAQQLGID